MSHRSPRFIAITLVLISFAAFVYLTGTLATERTAAHVSATGGDTAFIAGEPQAITTPINPITTFDAALIGRYVVTLPPAFNADQLTVADVDGGAGISSNDASQVASYVVNSGSMGSTGTTVPPGLLMGDVSGAGPHYDGQPGTVAVSLPSVNAGGIAIVPVAVGDVTGLGAISFEYQITFDPAVLQPATTPFSTSGTLTGDGSWIIRRNVNNPGHLIMSGFSPNALTGAGTLINLRFNTIGSPGQSTALIFEHYTDPGSRIHQSFLFDEGTPSTGTMTNGSVTIVPFTPTPTFTPTSTWTPTATSTSSPTLTATGTPAPEPVILYNQMGSGGGGVNSQDFDPDFDGIDCLAADDFIIPSGGAWIIKRIVVLGAYYTGNGPGGGPAESFNVQFFHDTANLPGIPVAGGSFREIPFSVNGPRFTIDLPMSVILAGGTYWMTVQANMDGQVGQWAWLDREVTSNSRAIWQNPNGGFNNPACYEWGPRAVTCGIDPTRPDQLFSIYGTDGTGNITPLPTYTSTSTPTASSTATASPTPTCNSPLVQNFYVAGGMPPAGWLKINHSEPLGQSNWHFGDTFAAQSGDSPDFAAVDSQSGSGTSTLSNWLITPILTLRDGTSITFWTRAAHLSRPDRLQIRLSTNGASTDVGTSSTEVGDFETVLLDINEDYKLSGYPFKWTKFTATVSGVPSSVTGRFAFRYFVENGGPSGNNSDHIGIDTVSVDSCDVPPASPTPTFDPNAVPVSLPAVSATPGSELILPITVGDLTGLGVLAYDFQLSFDPAIVTLAAPVFDTAGTLSSQMTVSTNTNNPGHLIISAFRSGGSGPMSGSGTLINLKFTVVGNSGETTPLTFEDFTEPNNHHHVGFQLNEGVPNSSVTNGQITIFGTALSGTVTYGNSIAFPNPRYISDVTMTGAGLPTVTATTRASGLTVGQYWLSGFGPGPYVVTPSKTGGVNGAVTSYDAALIAQHVSGTPNHELGVTQLAVADVSENGTVSSFDAAMIAKYVAGPPYISPGIGSTATWRFAPVNRSYDLIITSLAGQDFVGLLMGEVSGNWLNTGVRPAGSGGEAVSVDGPRSSSPVEEIHRRQLPGGSGPEREVGVELPQIDAAVGKKIIVPVSVRNIANKDVISYEFDLRYDASVMQPEADPVALNGTLSGGLSVVTSAYEPGLLRVVVYGAIPIDDDGVLLNLRFVPVGKSGSGSGLTFERFIFNEGEPRVNVVDGKIELF